jgi:hypothetical protein
MDESAQQALFSDDRAKRDSIVINDPKNRSWLMRYA